jgi:transposase
MVAVEQWAELRRQHFVGGVSIKELARRSGLSRNTVRAAVRGERAPRYQRPAGVSKLEPFKEEIHRLLAAEPGLSGVRVREEIEPLGFVGGKTIVDDYLRDVRPLFVVPRTFQRTVYRPGELCQFDLWKPSREIPVGHGQTRRGYVVIAASAYSRAGAGALVFSKEAVDILWGIARCLAVLGGIARTLVWDREGSMHGGGGRPSRELAEFCGLLRCGWHLCAPRDCQAKGVVERLQGYAETNFEPGRSFANELDFQLQLDDWFTSRANVRTHRSLRCRPVDRLEEDVAAMIAVPEQWPVNERRWVTRVPVDPYLRLDTNDYSLDPMLAGRRVDVRVSQTTVAATVLDTGEVAAQHQRSFAKHRTITALEHARALKELRGARTGPSQPDPEVQTRSLAVYDQLIGA